MRIYDLEQPRFRGMPIHPAHGPVGYSYILHRQHKDVTLSGPTRSGASGAIFMTEHVGTHIDALCHQALNHRLRGEIEVTDEVETPYGFSVHGIEKAEPLVGRGVLLDAAGCQEAETLTKYHEITSAELEECCRRQNLEIRRGDTVLVRTGYGKFWNSPERYGDAAGVGLDGARWLSSMGIRAAGADNMSFEVDDGRVDKETGTTLPSHVHLLVKNGIYIIENVNLEKLALEKVFDFFFVCSPLKMVGATGSPVRPLAISEMNG